MLNTAEYPFALALAAKTNNVFNELQDEGFKALMNHSLKATPDITGVNTGWLKGFIREDNVLNQQGSLFAGLARLVKDFKSHPVIRSAYYACLTPGSQALFTGDDSTLRLHFGLMIPDGNCGITLGGKDYKWAQRLPFLFEPSQGAKVWNKTKFPRLILAFDLSKKYL